MKNTKINQEKWLNKIEDTLKIGGRSNRTFDNYKSHIKRFLNYYDENTDINKLNEDDILSYLKIKYINLNVSENTLNLAECSICFLFTICFDKSLNKKKLPCCKVRKRMPSILSKEDFIKIFNSENNLKHKCWLLLAYCSCIPNVRGPGRFRATEATTSSKLSIPINLMRSKEPLVSNWKTPVASSLNCLIVSGSFSIL